MTDKGTENGGRIIEMEGLTIPIKPLTPEQKKQIAEGLLKEFAPLVNRTLAEQFKTDTETAGALRELIDSILGDSRDIYYEITGELEPYIQAELSKPEYNGQTLRDLLNQYDITDLAHIPEGDTLHKVIEAARAAKAAAERRTEVEKYLQGDRAFMVTPRPKGIDPFLRIDDANNLREFEKMRVEVVGRLGIDEQKIHELIRIAFTECNYYKADRNLNLVAELPFYELMDVLGRRRTPANEKKFAQRLAKEILQDIAHEGLTFTDENNKAITHFEIGTGTYKVDRKNNKVYFEVSPLYALYLNRAGVQVQYSRIGLRMGSQKDPLPFYLQAKMQAHYFRDANRQRGTNNILSIKTLLKYSADILPSFEWVQENDPGHWLRLIRDPLEKALNEIESGGLFKWEYCGPRLAEVEKSETRTNDFRKWSRLYITFQLIPEEPDQTERLENKRARIEAANREKDITDAQKVIEAEKIKQRNAKRKKRQQHPKHK